MDISEKEFERLIQRSVKEKFEAIRGRTGVKLPWIGDPYYPEQHDDQYQSVLQALRCRRWFEFEAPPWAQPLPLSDEACIALFNGPNRDNRRLHMVGRYGQRLRGMNWNYQRATPFEIFCAGCVAPS
jgi:hypothetical protein